MDYEGVKIGNVYYPTNEEKEFLRKRKEIIDWFEKEFLTEEYQRDHLGKWVGVGENREIYVGNSYGNLKDIAKSDGIKLVWTRSLNNEIDIFSPEFEF